MYSVGFATNVKVRVAIAKLPRKVWTPATDADGDVREGGDVTEITALLDLSGWPAGMRWLRLLALPPELAKAEPKALRYRLLHVPAELTTGGRRRRLRVPSNWPWAAAIVSAFARIAAFPAPG